jgi:hypothetical protein
MYGGPSDEPSAQPWSSKRMKMMLGGRSPGSAADPLAIDSARSNAASCRAAPRIDRPEALENRHF